MDNNKFEQWCILEIMGHQRFAGFVTEQSVGGTSFVRIDVPGDDGCEPFTKLFGAGSIYCITPVSEQIARAMSQSLRREPVSVYELPVDMRDRLRTNALPYESDTDGKEDDFT